MRIIKPYGRSHTERDDAAKLKRVLRLRRTRDSPCGPDVARDIEEFARSREELVIAQWISTIDKIATKPKGEEGPTDEQRKFRDRLGDAAWAYLAGQRIFSGLSEPQVKDHLAKIWGAKIAPYGSATYEPRTDKKGRKLNPPSAKGRWYDRFAGTGVAVADVDAPEIAQKIHEHLHLTEYRISDKTRSRRQGRIALRATSITDNVLLPANARPEPKKRARGLGTWTDADCRAYEVRNVACEIRRAGEARENGKDGARTRRVTLDIAGRVLFDHYARLFADADGKPLGITRAEELLPGLFDLHMAVKDCYSRVLKNHKKNLKVHGKDGRKVSTLLPATMSELFALVNAKRGNRDLNALVRLGKIIYYDSSVGDLDQTSDPVNHWPADVTGSRFWTSDGQAEIKRNEAFVRVWRHVLALASRTLRDWTDPEGSSVPDDILLNIDDAIAACFANERYSPKLDVLFGSRAGLFKDKEAFEKSVLKLALRGIADVRHGSFHFKGLGGFIVALTGSPLAIDPLLLDTIRELWNADLRGRAARLLQAMRGSHFDYFLDEQQNRRLFAALSDSTPAGIALPRFARILERAENAWKGKDRLVLPQPANRAQLENPGRLCQYTALKLVYERPFRRWLAARDTAILNGFIDRAVARATEAAIKINADKDKDRAEIMVARADALGGLNEGDKIETFFFNLSADTASEMRVQRGYDSDAETAREQAAYIENLKCDVLALAFRAYLREADFEFLPKLPPDAPKPEAPLFTLNDIDAGNIDLSAETWQCMLYFLIHLVPVEEIGKLLHQMRKWRELARKGGDDDPDMARQVKKAQFVLELYLDMHDAQFEGGGAALIGAEPFKAFFDKPVDFERIFEYQPGDEDGRRIPRRGLREIMRFGHLPVLRAIFEKHRVTAAQVAEFLAFEAPLAGGSNIARCQQAREFLHDNWVDKKPGFRYCREYEGVLRDVTRHRHLAAHVMLTDHVRLHRLLMAVLGRLVDYSGLWERDLYFVTLALIREAGKRPGDVFATKGLERLKDGRIGDALDNLQDEAIAARLGANFKAGYGVGSHARRIRNNFAHFNMLRRNSGPVDLTSCVNDARALMAYDRKLRNAVSQSVKELLAREGMNLNWTMAADHRLGTSTLETRQAEHLGTKTILEDFHSYEYILMVAALFGSCEAQQSGEGKK